MPTQTHTITTAGPPGSIFAIVSGINASGEFVGYCRSGGPEQGFADNEGTITNIDVPASKYTSRGSQFCCERWSTARSSTATDRLSPGMFGLDRKANCRRCRCLSADALNYYMFQEFRRET